MSSLRNTKGQFVKGVRYNPETEFKKGEHWRRKKPYWNKDWCFNEYVVKKRSAMDIANQFDVTENAILYWLKKHDIATRSMEEIRSIKHWGSEGEDNPMWGRIGENNPNWKGGITPERQLFYQSSEWKKVYSFIWERDNAECQRCGVSEDESKYTLHVHHIKPFDKDKSARCDPSNLVLLCTSCHGFVHSKGNTENEYLQ